MRVFQPTYTTPGPSFDRPRKTRMSEVWWCEFTVNGQRFRKSTGLRDKNAAQARAAQLLRDEELRAAGIETHGDTSRATLACLLDEYRAEMTRRGCAKKHVETTLARCRALTQGVLNMAALTPVAVRLGLDRLRGASAKTVNGYRTALSGFCAWLVVEGRWTGNPVEGVSRAREVSDGPARRALTPKEQSALLAVASGTPRWLCYYVALNTGLRRAELDALTFADIVKVPDTAAKPDDFIQERYAVRVCGTTAKNRREDLLPLPAGLWIASPIYQKAKPCSPPSMAAFRRDLKAAGIDPTDVDFHSLRVTFATNLARAGVPLTMAQRLMRHSDPALTSNIYTRLRIDDEQAAVDRASPDQQGTTLSQAGEALRRVAAVGHQIPVDYAALEMAVFNQEAAKPA